MSCFVDTTLITSEATSTTDRSSSTPTSTTIYTLPSPNNKMMNSKTTTNNNNTCSYEEFPKPSSSSSSSTPSLPWFVEYWSSSLFNTPIMEKMFQCNGNERDVLDTTSSNMKLRQMVASRTMFDIDNDYDDTLMSDASTSIYPIKNITKRFPSIRKSSILQDDEEEDVASILDQAMTIIKESNPMMDDDDDDDTRDGIASVCSHKSVLDDYSSRMLYTCESFDQFLRGSTKSSHVVRLQPRPILGSDGDDALLSTTTPMATPLRPNQQQRLHPPSSPSATTYTTVSMTQSYMHEDSLFDDDSEFGDNDDEQENQDMTTNDDDFLHRWNEKSSKLFRGLEDKTNDPYMTPPHHTSSRKRSLFAEPPAAPIKKQLDDENNENENEQDHTEPYRYLIRMKPQNYLHHGSVEETKYDDENDDMYSLPSHLQLSSNMTFHEAFFMNNHKVLDIESKHNISSTPPPVMPEF